LSCIFHVENLYPLLINIDWSGKQNTSTKEQNESGRICSEYPLRGCTILVVERVGLNGSGSRSRVVVIFFSIK
jgi:hypothetical protein